MKTIFFDLDGTLLSMDLDVFIKSYFTQLTAYFSTTNKNVEVFVKGIMAGVQRMLQNSGEQTNETVFWQTFTYITKLERNEVEEELNYFYKVEFPKLKDLVEVNQNIVKAVAILKEKGYEMYVTTNPIFPKCAVYERLTWAGLNPQDFKDLTSYENNSYCKPSIDYYKAFMKKHKINAEECLMVGNDSLEDGVIQTLGVDVYLINDYLIHKEENEPKCTYLGDSKAFLMFCEKLSKVA